MKTCKNCLQEKPLEDFYSHPDTKDWRLSSCKECIKEWRRSENERIMARRRDNERSKRKDRIEYLTRNTKKFRLKNPEKYIAHKLIDNFFKKNPKLKPERSLVSWLGWRLHMHHFDYNKPNCVIPCTPLEHSMFHKWNIEIKEEYIITLPF